MQQFPRCRPVVSLLLVVAPAALAAGPPALPVQPQSRKLVRIGVLVAEIKHSPNSERDVYGGVRAPTEAGALRRRLAQQVRKGDARIIAQMDLVTVDGEPVEGFAAGEQHEMDRAKPCAEDAGTDREPAGTRVRCHPIIQQDGKIHLEYEPEVVRVSPNGGHATERVHTTVDLQSGETLVFGGLVKHVIVASQVSMPILGELPVLGSLFQYKSESEEDQETVYLLTATVCPDAGKPKERLRRP